MPWKIFSYFGLTFFTDISPLQDTMDEEKRSYIVELRQICTSTHLTILFKKYVLLEMHKFINYKDLFYYWLVWQNVKECKKSFNCSKKAYLFCFCSFSYQTCGIMWDLISFSAKLPLLIYKRERRLSASLRHHLSLSSVLSLLFWKLWKMTPDLMADLLLFTPKK